MKKLILLLLLTLSFCAYSQLRVLPDGNIVNPFTSIWMMNLPLGDNGNRLRLHHNNVAGYLDVYPTLHFRSAQTWSPIIMDFDATGLQLYANKILEFGKGNTKEASAGKIGYQVWTSGLDIVGAGTNTSNRTITFYSEGGAVFHVETQGATFLGNVRANNFIVNSDKKLKKNIQTVDHALEKILLLRGVNYEMNDSIDIEEELKDTYPSDTTRIKTITTATLKKVKRKMKLSTGTGYPTQYGLIAQEVEKVIPEAVATNDNGIKGVNYISIIPVLIEALKEQNQKIETLENEIKKLKKSGKTNAKEATNGGIETALSGSFLYQNSPNPFSTETSIRYNVSTEATDVFITVNDYNGKQLKLLKISSKGEGFVTLKANELSAGIYLYTLVADGNIVDTKRMVIVE